MEAVFRAVRGGALTMCGIAGYFGSARRAARAASSG